jgi:uncharacterized protein (TIGR02246 family)
MKVITASMNSVGIAFALCCLISPASAADDAMTIASAFNAKYEQAVASKDAAKLAEFFTPDAVFQNPVGIFKGRAAIQHYREGGFKAGVQKEDLSIAAAQKIGDVIYDYGETTIHIQSQSGSKDLKLRWGAVLTKSGNDWKIALLTATPEAPPPPQKQ